MCTGNFPFKAVAAMNINCHKALLRRWRKALRATRSRNLHAVSKTHAGRVQKARGQPTHARPKQKLLSYLCFLAFLPFLSFVGVDSSCSPSLGFS